MLFLLSLALGALAIRALLFVETLVAKAPKRQGGDPGDRPANWLGE